MLIWTTKIIFQLTASQGGWRLTIRLVRRVLNFNSQPHKEADDNFLWATFILDVFQLTASQGGWQSCMLQINVTWSFQLTASQGGWRAFWSSSWTCKKISTHSLTRRLTEYSPKKLKFVRYFNSQPHKEADFYLWQKESDSHISTHSLTRRLTLRRLTLLWFRIYFNSQPHKEADLTALPIPLIAPIFQLTASQGGWRRWVLTVGMRMLFQLTASQGGWRNGGTIFLFAHCIFQLTASQGGWLHARRSFDALPDFNSQPHKEADGWEYVTVQLCPYFNSQPHKEADDPWT